MLVLFYIYNYGEKERYIVLQIKKNAIAVATAVLISANFTAVAFAQEPVLNGPAVEMAANLEGTELVKNTTEDIAISDDEIKIIAKILDVEAGADTKDNRIGIAEVIKNRIDSPMFPNSVKKVVTQPHQFSNYKFGDLTEENIQIVKDVFSERVSLLSDDAFFFRNPDKCKSAKRGQDWGNYKFEKTLGLHDFYYYEDKNL